MPSPKYQPKKWYVLRGPRIYPEEYTSYVHCVRRVSVLKQNHETAVIAMEIVSE